MLDTSKVIVELGAGTGAFRDRFLPGALTTDLQAAEGIDILADATKLPFKPGSVDEFVANNPYEFGVKFLKELNFFSCPNVAEFPRIRVAR